MNYVKIVKFCKIKEDEKKSWFSKIVCLFILTSHNAIKKTTKKNTCERGRSFDDIWLNILGNWHFRHFYRLLYGKKVWDKSSG